MTIGIINPPTLCVRIVVTYRPGLLAQSACFKTNFFTTTYVIDEVATFFNSRNRHSKAVETVDCLMNSPSVNLIHVEKAFFTKAGSISDSMMTNPILLQTVFHSS